MAHWTTGNIVFLVYFLSVPLIALAFLVWVHVRFEKKPITTKTEVPAQVILVDEGIVAGDIRNDSIGIEMQDLESRPRGASLATTSTGVTDYERDQDSSVDAITAA
jgi:hypothetical protein